VNFRSPQIGFPSLQTAYDRQVEMQHAMELSPENRRGQAVSRPHHSYLPAALFLPFPCNKEQQTAANRGTKRRLKIAKFYE